MDMQYPVMSLQHDATSFLHILLDLWHPFTCGTSESKWRHHFLEVYFKISFCFIYRMSAILSNPQVVLHLSHNLPAEWNCSCISKCFYSIIHIKELSVIVKIQNNVLLKVKRYHEFYNQNIFFTKYGTIGKFLRYTRKELHGPWRVKAKTWGRRKICRCRTLVLYVSIRSRAHTKYWWIGL